MKWLDLPPVWLLLFLIAGWMQLRLTGPLFGGTLCTGLGAGMVVLGAGLTLAAAWEFRRHRTSIVPHRWPEAIVTSGVYGLSRNPIYLADALFLTGFGLIFGSPLALALVPVLVRVIARRFIAPEEARLAERFPEAFAAYAARVRRWV